MSEHDSQVTVIQWATLSQKKYPFLELLHAIPNAAKRSPRLASMMKAEGLKAGVPDLNLPVARNGYIGLYIEMKHGKNKTTDSQAWWIARLIETGHKVEICYSADEAINVIKEYYK